MLKILEKLIAAESISPKDDGLMDYISRLLSASGFKCYLKEFGEGEDLTKNLYAEYGAEGKNLCFAGHIDVVPSGDRLKWKYDPFKMTIDGDLIYGRGAVDMKGAVSCMLKAGLEWSKNNNGRISFLLTSDEEASAENGTQKMLEYMKDEGLQIDFAIIGEPTSSEKFGDTIKIGRRGSINFALKIFGKQGHVAYPSLASNPNTIIVKVLNRLLKHKIDGASDFFDASNLEIISIDTGNSVSNLIPYSSSAKFNVRFSNLKEAEEIIEEIRSIITNVTNDFELESNVSARAFLTEKTDFTEKFKEVVKKECGLESIFSTSGGTSDARFIKDYCSLVEFGLINKTAHHIDEHTEINHLQKLFTVYYEAIKTFHKAL